MPRASERRRISHASGQRFKVGPLAAGLALLVLAIPGAGEPPAAPTATPVPMELDADRRPALVTHGDCFLRGGTLLTVTHGVIPNGDLLVQRGKIAAMGRGLTPPPGVPVIDVAGRFVTPGLIDAHSHIAADEINEWSDSVTAEVRIHDVLDPRSLSLYQKLAAGFTTSLVLHGSANAIGGQSVVIKHRWQRPVDELIVPDAPRMIKFALGENPRALWRTPRRFPQTRMGVEAVYRRAFTEARRYMAEWDAYEKERQSHPAAVPPRRDLRLEALADILRGRIWVQCHCYRADEMLMMLRLKQEFGFKLAALHHALEAYKIAPQIAAAGVGVSTFADLWGYKVEAYDAIPYNAAMCVRAGIVTSVNTDSFSGMTPLNLEAAKCMKFGGLTENEALRLITLNPALQLGIGHRTGSLEVGKDGDLAVWDGHPFSVYARCAMTFIEGELFYQRRDAFGLDSRATFRSHLAVCPSDHLHLPLPPAARSYAIVGGTVHPVSGPEIPDGTVVVTDGRIAAVGKQISLPRGAVRVQARGLQVYPGLIDAGSTLGLTEIDGVPAASDGAEGGEFQPDLLALTAINAASEHFAVARCGGLTAALSRPSGGGLVAGQSALIHLAGGTPEAMKLQSPAALHVHFPDDASALYRSVEQAPTEEERKRLSNRQKMARQRLGDFFERAKRYAATRAQAPERATPDAPLAAMVPYVTGQAPVIFHVDSARGIRDAVEFAEKWGLRPIIADGHEAGKVADLLAKKRVPVIYQLPDIDIGGAEEPLNDYDPVDSVLAMPALLHRAGVRFCLESDSAALAKNLAHRAGACGAFGLSPDAALRAVTLDAAEILGVGNRLGSLTPGKIADLIITDGDPLEVTTSLHYLFIAGRPLPLESRHTRLYTQYRQP